MYCFKKSALEEKLKLLSTDNDQGEYYLTDTVELLANSGEYVGAVVAERAEDTLGINNRVELAEATAILKKRILDRLMLSGVTVEDTATTFIDADVEIGKDTVIKPCTILESGTVIGEDCIIGPFVRLTACRLGNKVTASQVSIVNEIIPGPAELGQNGGKLWSSANSLERS
jgi:bifunctional UDP-N-acetylglucosamine pyrophosphorylase/glucosamine-1-phosphate N-acetyltransferase